MRTEEEIFVEAVVMPAADRAAFLPRACGGDLVMRERIERLLNAHGEDGFMSGPVREAEESLFPEGRGEKSGDRIGNYELLQQIGTGGFGTVWMASQKEPVRQRVALKILKLGMDSREVVARFEQERQTLALMNHPHIARIYDAGTTPSGRPFIAMELVHGVMLTRYCDERQMDTRDRLLLFTQICQAIQHAHQKGIIHRDLKPSNVLVTGENGNPMVKVIDFGVAKATQAVMGDHTLYTQFEQMVGTPLYMSPEQTGYSVADADTRSDIYSLGVLLYELLTGSTPIANATLVEKGREEVRRFICEVDPPRPSLRVRSLTYEELTTTARRRLTEPSRLSSLLHGDLDWIVMKCLEKDRTRRYETANALATDIGRHLKDEPVIARPPGTVYTLRKMIRRHRGLFAASAALVLVLLAGIAVSAGLAIRSSKAEQAQTLLRKQAEESRREAVSNRNEALLRAYEADMSAASLLQAKGETGQVAELIQRHLPRDGMPDFRGFEWRHLHDQVKGDQVAVMEGHRNMVSAVTFSRSGRLIASGDLGGGVNVWEAGTGHLVSSPRAGSSRIVGVSFSHDDKFLAAGDATHVYIWSVPEFRLEKRLPFASVRPVYSPSSPVLALGVNDNRWNSDRGDTLLWSWQEDPDGTRMRRLSRNGTRIAFSADGTAMTTSGTGDKLRVLDLKTGGRIAEIPRVLAVEIALARDASWLACTGSSQRGSPFLFSLPDGRPMGPLEGDAKEIRSIAASPVEDVLATGSSNQRITLWNVITRKPQGIFTGHRGEVTALAFSPDGQLLASGSMDETVRLWRVGTRRPGAILDGMEVRLGMGGPKLSADGQLIAASTAGRVLKVYRTETLEEVSTISEGRWPLAFSPDGKKLVTLHPRGMLELWETAGGANAGRIRLPFPPHAESISVLSPDGSLLGLCHYRNLYFIETQTGKVLFHSDDHDSMILGSVFSPDGKLHATVAQDSLVIVREVPSGKTVYTFTGHKQDVRAVTFSPDGRLLATGGHDDRIKIWDLSNGRQAGDITGHKQVVNYLAFSRDGKTLFSAGDDDALFFWRVGDWRSIGRHPIPTPARSLNVSQNGSLLAVTGEPGRLILFRAPYGLEWPEPPLPARPWKLDSLPPCIWTPAAGIPARAKDVPSVCIDLTGHYNARLDDSWTADFTDSSCSLIELPAGLNRLGGIPRDCRGIVQLYPPDEEVPGPRLFPDAVTGIRMNQKASRLHFLCGAVWGSLWQRQPEIGKLIMHYADGKTATRSIVLGVDVLDWFDKSPVIETTPVTTPVVWSGSNERSRQVSSGLRLFDVVWNNLRPDVAVTSIDFVVGKGCPFVIAITAEP